MTLKQWAGKTDLEAEKEIRRLEEELFHLRMKKVTGGLDKMHKLAATKRDIARGFTYMQSIKK